MAVHPTVSMQTGGIIICIIIYLKYKFIWNMKCINNNSFVYILIINIIITINLKYNINITFICKYKYKIRYFN